MTQAPPAQARRWPQLAAIRWDTALIGLGSLVIFWLTRSGVHTFDGLSYIRDVNAQSSEPVAFFFHPHHLLYSPTGWLMWRLWWLLGYGGDAALPLQALNSVVAAGCGVVLGSLVRRVTGRAWAGLLSAGLLLFNYGVWLFAVEVEVYIWSLWWLVLALWAAERLMRRPSTRAAVVLGAAVGLSGLYHQTNGLIAPIVAGAVLLSAAPWPAKLRLLVISGAGAGGLVLAVYAVIGFAVLGQRTLHEFWSWMFFYLQAGYWGRATHDRWSDTIKGLSDSLTSEGARAYWLGIAALVMAGIVPAARRWPRLVALCGLWLAVFGGFFIWWEADNIEFWIGTLVPLWVVCGLAAAALAELPALRAARRALPAVLALPALLLWHNIGLLRRRGDAAQDLPRQIAAQAAAVSAPDDVFVLLGGMLELYLPYYERRPNVHILDVMFFDAQNDPARAYARLEREISAGLGAGLRVFVDRDIQRLPPETLQRYAVTQPDLDRFWAPYRPFLTPAVTQSGTVYFKQLPTASERAAGAGWQWAGFDWGWQGSNLGAATLERGWCFAPGSDPMLLSPRLDLPATATSVEVTLRTAAADQTAQLFWAGPDGAMSAAQSVEWPVIGDGAAHTYRVALPSSWRGTVTRLRLDPIAVGDGTAASATCVDELRLR